MIPYECAAVRTFNTLTSRPLSWPPSKQSRNLYLPLFVSSPSHLTPHREREIVILTEAQQELKHDLRTFKADYVSADAEDVIQALRKRQRGLNNQV